MEAIWPAQIQDVKAAIRYVRSNAANTTSIRRSLASPDSRLADIFLLLPV
jgi:hypothetical protein